MAKIADAHPLEVCEIIKDLVMQRPKRDILVVVKNHLMSEQAIEQEVVGLNEILRFAESDEQFCIAHELVKRNRITQKPARILKAIRFAALEPFYFLINRN